jgi:hypothetical protein
MFCDEHRLARTASAMLARSPRFRRALEKRIDGGWTVHLDWAWVHRTRIERESM